MKDLLLILAHLLTTLAKLLGPGGAKAIVADSLILKQQLLIVNRSRPRAPNLTIIDRLLLGPTWPAVLTQFNPMIAKTLMLPGNHCSSLDKYQRAPPPRPSTCEPRPEHTIPGTNSWAFDGSLIHIELMSQCDDLEL
jgi:hypothetical protein